MPLRLSIPPSLLPNAVNSSISLNGCSSLADKMQTESWAALGRWSSIYKPINFRSLKYGELVYGTLKDETFSVM